MRCKIIKIGPQDSFVDDIERFRGKKGTLKRTDMYPAEWLSGQFTFDDPNQRPLFFYQIHVEPIDD